VSDCCPVAGPHIFKVELGWLGACCRARSLSMAIGSLQDRITLQLKDRIMGVKTNSAAVPFNPDNGRDPVDVYGDDEG